MNFPVTEYSVLQIYIYIHITALHGRMRKTTSWPMWVSQNQALKSQQTVLVLDSIPMFEKQKHIGGISEETH